MGTVRTDEFRKDAVRIALTSGLPRKQFADDLGVGMSTLNNRITARRDTDVVSHEDRELALENERLRRENRILREERDILKKAIWRSGQSGAPAVTRLMQQSRYKLPFAVPLAVNLRCIRRKPQAISPHALRRMERVFTALRFGHAESTPSRRLSRGHDLTEGTAITVQRGHPDHQDLRTESPPKPQSVTPFDTDRDTVHKRDFPRLPSNIRSLRPRKLVALADSGGCAVFSRGCAAVFWQAMTNPAISLSLTADSCLPASSGQQPALGPALWKG